MGILDYVLHKTKVLPPNVHVVSVSFLGQKVWDDTESDPFKAFGAMVVNAAACAGRIVGSVTEVVGDGLTEISNLAAYIPIVGGALHGVLLIASGPLSVTEGILKGERIDRVLIADFKEKITAFREVAPLAKTILTFTGVGAGVIAGLSMATALAEGTPISDALLSGIGDALPGGAIARAALVVTTRAVQGDNILDASFQATMNELPSEARSALIVVQKAAQGENIPMAALEEARKQLPPVAQKGLDIGIALGQGKKIQLSVKDIVNTSAPELFKTLKSEGNTIITENPVFMAGRNLATRVEKSYNSGRSVVEKSIAQMKAESFAAGYAFDLGAGLMQKSGVNEDTIKAVKAKLDAKTQIPAFDLAITIHIGQVTNPPPDKVELVRMEGVSKAIYDYYSESARTQEIANYFANISRGQSIVNYLSSVSMSQERAEALAAYYARIGMVNSLRSQRDVMVGLLMSNPNSTVGAVTAQAIIDAKKGGLEKILNRFGLSAH